MKNKILIAVLLICLLSFFAGCGAKGYDSETPNASPEVGQDAPEISSPESGILSNSADRKLIYTFYYSLNVSNALDSSDTILEAVKANGGFVESSSQSGTQSTSVYLVARIPVGKVEAFSSDLSKAGTVVDKRIESTDVTAQLETYEEKLASLNAQLNVYKNMDTSTFTFSEQLLVLEKIAALESEIDSVEDKKQATTAKVEYSTFTIRLYQNYTPEEEQGFFTKLWNNFVDSIKSMGAVFEFIVTAVVVILPYGVIIGLIITLIVLIKRKAKKGKPEKNQNDKDKEVLP